MLNDIYIRNFKGISQTSINELNQVNVFIGKNNVGKSTVLDALYFLKAPLSPINAVGYNTLNYLLKRRSRRKTYDVTRFWYLHDVSNPIFFTLSFDKSSLTFECTKLNEGIKYDLSKSLPTSGGAPLHFSLSLKADKTKYRVLDRADEAALGIPEVIQDELTRHLSVPDLETAEFYEDIYKGLNFLRDLIFVNDALIQMGALMEEKVMTMIIMQRTDNELIHVLNEIYGFDVEQLAFVPCGDGGFKLLLKTPKFSFDVDDCGDGMRYTLYSLALASGLKDTAVLWEEPENHQNLHSLKALFKFLVRTASKNNLQIIMTTHNLDALQILFHEAKEKLNVYNFERDRDGTTSCNAIDITDAKRLMHL